jgi:hypothetical protein
MSGVENSGKGAPGRRLGFLRSKGGECGASKAEAEPTKKGPAIHTKINM